MSHFFDAVRKGIKATKESMGPGQFNVGDKQVTCPHCGNQEFAKGSAQLNTAGMTFIGLDWVDKTAHTLMCTKCGRIEWFGQEPERV